MTDSKTKIVSEVIRITPAGQVTREHMLGRAIVSKFSTGFEVSLASITADLEAKGLFEPGEVPETGKLHSHYWAGSVNHPPNRSGTDLLRDEKSKAPCWIKTAFGDAVIRLDAGRPRRCIKVDSTNTLQDALDFIEMNGIEKDFAALEDNDVWVIQKTRNRKSTRTMLMYAKLRFK
jgi:hypothetical protein